MSLSFTVNAGPLSQIGLEIASLSTAYQLAMGAYGWFKAIERSKSLTELLSVSGGELVGTSSFNFDIYKDIRMCHTAMQGVVVQDRRMQYTGLPRGSTAVPSHSGIACLRALTAGLLCLYRPDATAEILQDLIPYALIQLNQEGTVIEMEGALLAGLRHWVSAVAVEEDSDMFRKYMLDRVMRQQLGLTGMAFDDIMGMDYTEINEIPYVIGVLRWILTPLHKRNLKQYPTRSLTVWTTASVMQTLGFEVQAASVMVHSVQDYDDKMRASSRSGETPDVFLVVMNDVETDPGRVNHVFNADDSPRPQITMIRGIPWIAFRHLRGYSEEIDTQYLADVWKYSFKSAKACFRGIATKLQDIHLEIAESELDGISEHHKSLISEFSPELGRICGPAMRQFVPMSSHSPGWNLSELREQMRVLRTEQELYLPRSPCRGNCYVLYAIVCGALYGLCSNACYDNGNVLSEDSEVAFIPDILYESGGKRLREWARIVGHSLRSHQAFSQWRDLLFEMFLGKDTESGTSKSSQSKYTNQQNPYKDRLLLGAQANGLVAVSEMLVATTIRVKSFCYFHIKRGQILNLPLTEDQYIQASAHIEPAHTLALDPEPKNSTLYRFEAEDTHATMRIDVEPAWEEDPRTVVFRARLRGVPIASLNISTFLDGLSYQAVPCKCPEPSWEVLVPFTERWQLVTLHQLQRTRFKGMSFRRVDVNDADARILIDASQSVAATVYAVCILHVRGLFVALECLACAHKQAMINSQNAGVTIVIPIRGDS